MRGLEIVQVCADRGIAPGSTKGAALHLRGIATGFEALGHSVTTYSLRRPEGEFPVAVRRLEELASHSRRMADVIYERYSLGHTGGLDLARAIGAGFVLEVNAPLVDEALAHRPETVERQHRDVELELLRAADLVITVSTELSAWVRQRRAGPTVAIPNGFEPRWFGRPPNPQRDPTLVFLGHPKPWHGADRLPHLLADLMEAGKSVRLLVIGGGQGAAELMSLAHSVGVADRMTVTGALPPEQAAALLATATIGLAPYPRTEPFYFCPLKVIDYLAAGLPVVATRQGDIEELVGDAGVTVDPDDTDGFTEAVVRILDDRLSAAEMGRRGRERAIASMTWTGVAERTLAAVESLRALEKSA